MDDDDAFDLACIAAAEAAEKRRASAGPLPNGTGVVSSNSSTSTGANGEPNAIGGCGTAPPAAPYESWGTQLDCGIDPCYRCGDVMVQKSPYGGRTFYGCQSYPWCRVTRSTRRQTVTLELVAAIDTLGGKLGSERENIGGRSFSQEISNPDSGGCENAKPLRFIAMVRPRGLKTEDWNSVATTLRSAVGDAYFCHCGGGSGDDRPFLRMPLAAALDLLPALTALARRRQWLLRAPPRSTVAALRAAAMLPPPAAPGAAIEAALWRVPAALRQALLPFQREGLAFGLLRNGRCLIADEMGTGKTLQALAIAACYMEDWPLLIVVPASMRLTWASEVERWFPRLPASEVHVILGSEDRLDREAPEARPRVTVVSFHMLHRLKATLGSWRWDVVLVDESHQLTTRQRGGDCCEQTEVCLRVVRAARRAVLLSGTPSLSRPFDMFSQVNALRPGVLGNNKRDYAGAYCDVSRVNIRNGRSEHGGDGGGRSGYGGRYGGGRCGGGGDRGGQGARSVYQLGGALYPDELHALLRATVMIRRLKCDVVAQLPPMRRTVVRVTPDASLLRSARQDRNRAAAAAQAALAAVFRCGEVGEAAAEGGEDWDDFGSGGGGSGSGRRSGGRGGGGWDGPPSGPMSKYHEAGLQKVAAAAEWLLDKLLASEETGTKFVVYAHHSDVLDAIQAQLTSSPRCALDWAPFLRVDGETAAADRRDRIARFAADAGCRALLVSVTAGGQGLDLSVAAVAVFLELPPRLSWLRQAEDRLHRRGQRRAVNVYYLVLPPGSDDDQRWLSMSQRLDGVSAVVNGAGRRERIAVDGVTRAGDLDDYAPAPSSPLQLAFATAAPAAPVGATAGRATITAAAAAGDAACDTPERQGSQSGPGSPPAASPASVLPRSHLLLSVRNRVGDDRDEACNGGGCGGFAAVYDDDWAQASSSAEAPIALDSEDDGDSGNGGATPRAASSAANASSASAAVPSLSPRSTPCCFSKGKRRALGGSSGAGGCDSNDGRGGGNDDDEAEADAFGFLSDKGALLRAVASPTLRMLTQQAHGHNPAAGAPREAAGIAGCSTARRSIGGDGGGAGGAGGVGARKRVAVDASSPPALAFGTPAASAASLAGSSKIRDFGGVPDCCDGGGGGCGNGVCNDGNGGSCSGDSSGGDGTRSNGGGGGGGGKSSGLPNASELFFEVSKHTGRIHLHGEADGSRHLGGSFVPESVYQLLACGTLRRRIAKEGGGSGGGGSETGGGGGGSETGGRGIISSSASGGDGAGGSAGRSSFPGKAAMTAAAAALEEDSERLACATELLQSLPRQLREDHASLALAAAFLEEYRALGPRQRSALHGKPARPPLAAAVAATDACRGAATTASRRRYTPAAELLGSADLELAALFADGGGGYGGGDSGGKGGEKGGGGSGDHGSGNGGISRGKGGGGDSVREVVLFPRPGVERRYRQWLVAGARRTPQCLLCDKPACDTDPAAGPQTLRDLMCSKGCFERYGTKTSGRSLRAIVGRRDRGVCEDCGFDTRQLVQEVKAMTDLEDRRHRIAAADPRWAFRPRLLERLAKKTVEGSAWEADHVVGVAEGGGECDADNVRTLCVLCHAANTARQAGARAAARAAARKAKEPIQRLNGNSGSDSRGDGSDGGGPRRAKRGHKACSAPQPSLPSNLGSDCETPSWKAVCKRQKLPSPPPAAAAAAAPACPHSLYSAPPRGGRAGGVGAGGQSSTDVDEQEREAGPAGPGGDKRGPAEAGGRYGGGGHGSDGGGDDVNGNGGGDSGSDGDPDCAASSPTSLPSPRAFAYTRAAASPERSLFSPGAVCLELSSDSDDE